METLPLSYTKPEEKDGSGHLLPEVRERVMGEIENYIKKTGQVNYSFLSEKLGLNKITIRDMVSELAEEWPKYYYFDIVSQIWWMENLMVEMELEPEKFDSKRMSLINFRLGLIDKMVALMKSVNPGNSISIVKEEVNFTIFKQLKPKTLEFMRQQRESQNQQEPQQNSENI